MLKNFITPVLLLFVPLAQGGPYNQKLIRGAKLGLSSNPLHRQLQADDELICLDYKVDFNNFAPGTYVTDQLHVTDGIKIYAEGPGQAYTPDGAVRIFDTSNPGDNDDNGDPDLGSPNKSCPQSGPGKGNGGGPSAAYPNCQSLGNVIVIQESDKIYPDDAADGGDIFFTFDYPVVLMTLGLLDIEEKALAKLTTWYADNSEPNTWDAEATGNNGYYSYPILEEKNVIEFKVHLPGSGALSHIEYRMCRPEGDLRDANITIPDDDDPNLCPE